MADLLEYFRWFTKRFKEWLLATLGGGVAITLIILFLKNKEVIPANWWFAHYIFWIIYAFLWIVTAILHRLMMYFSFKTLHIDTIQGRWFVINSDGDIKSDFKYIDITNARNEPAKEFRPDREGFFVPVSDYSPVYKVTASNDTSQTVEVISAPPSYVHSILVDGRQTDMHIYESTLHFFPPLPPNQKLTLLRSYDVSGSEKGSFFPSSSYAGIRVFYPTRAVHLQMFSPAHYRIKLISHHVANEGGEENTQLSKKIRRPTIQEDGRYIDWKILYPKNDYRYWFKYQLISLLELEDENAI